MWRRRRPAPSMDAIESVVPLGARVVQACNPHWRGIRTAADAFGAPILEYPDFTPVAARLAALLAAGGSERIVVQGWPPGAANLAREAHRAGLAVGVVSHASLVQHGTDAGEAERVAETLDLARQGVIDRLGFVKRGLAEAFRAMGHPAHALANRMPRLPQVAPDILGSGEHIGIFLDPYWRKNVTTQLAAVMILDATAHVMQRPAVPYFPVDRIVEHGVLPRDRFLRLLAGVDLNLHVTLSECHPMTPMESYLLGVPCLISHTSALFEDDPDLLALTAVVAIDDPDRIARQARALSGEREEAVSRARASLRRMDAAAADAWSAFIA